MNKFEKIVFKTTEHRSFENYGKVVNEDTVSNLWSVYLKSKGGNIIFPSKNDDSSVLLGARTKEKAATVANKANFNYDAFIVLKNADFTEGRGPMLYNALFNDYDKAVAYAMSHEGIFGSKQGPEITMMLNTSNEVFGYVRFNGYKIIPAIYEDYKISEEVVHAFFAKTEMRKLIFQYLPKVPNVNDIDVPANVTVANLRDILVELNTKYHTHLEWADFIEIVLACRSYDALAERLAKEIPIED